jgi:hypothetical protein
MTTRTDLADLAARILTETRPDLVPLVRTAIALAPPLAVVGRAAVRALHTVLPPPVRTPLVPACEAPPDGPAAVELLDRDGKVIHRWK